MRPSAIPDAEVWPGTIRTVIAPPGGNFLDPEVSAIEALFESGNTRVNRYSVRMILEEGDLSRLERGDPFWFTVNTPQMPVFSMGFAVFSVPTGRCRNCRKPIVAPEDEELTPTTVVFHESPGSLPPCTAPEIEWVEADPPPLTSRRSWGDLQTVIGERCQTLFANTVEREGLALAEEASEVLVAAAGRACRAILKRAEGVRRSGPEWTALLRKEVAQVVMVAANLAHLEGFDLLDAVEEAAEALLEYDVERKPDE